MMKKFKKVTVYCGESIQDKCNKQLHPIVEVKNANNLILSENDEVAYSNSSDFISAIKYIGEKHNIITEFYLDGEYCGDDIEPIFRDLNRSLILMDKLSE